MAEQSEVFRILSDERRRIALSCLCEHETLALADLSELVAERESGDHISDITPERVRDVYFSLYHTHVPKLTEAGLARYQQEDDVVGTTERTRPALRAARDELDAVVRDERH